MSGFKITDWLFFFGADQREIIRGIHKKGKVSSDFKSWIFISIVLPFLTYLLAAIFNVILCEGIDNFSETWPTIFLNGSLPIISFGIISSGVPFLMEELSKENSDIQRIRRRVMAIALLFLFLTAGFYFFQTVSIINDKLNQLGSFLVLILSVVISLFSVSVGFKMFLLQSSFQKDIGQAIRNNTIAMIQEIESHNPQQDDEPEE